MASLNKDLRRQLERTVAEAREIGEAGAEQSLKRLAVDVSRPHDALTTEEKKFRVGLRVHARQLGDRLDARPTRLIQAVAYEHWHRLLFARFLIENDLLLHPEHGVALSLDEVKELALGENREWVGVAAEYAQRMLLRRVFEPEDPSLRVPLPPEKRLQLEAKLNSLPRDVFLADDSLGWVYQFWQRDENDRVNKSGVKIGADELAPVTQRFTEDYMVLFLLENTLGAWWTMRHGKSELPGYSWTYLRLKEDGSPAGGMFDGWPTAAKELRVLDPCMGSGHFLTFALPILARMRVAEEGLSLTDAIFAVLRDNLFGLELDPRCSQIAAFNLAMAGWKHAGKHFEIPQLNLACSGLGINAKEEDWVNLAGADGRKQELMRWLYSLFSNAPTLGSLIDPRRLGKPMFEHEIASLIPILEKALATEQTSDDTRELAIAAQGVLAAARILMQRFTLVATNVPYLARGKQKDSLREYCETFHGDAKTDLATSFIDRALRACASGGSIALVTPQNWLFQAFYKDLRPRILKTESLDFVAWLGPHAFQEITGEVVKVVLLGITHRSPDDSHAVAGWDVETESGAFEKSQFLRVCPTQSVSQAALLKNPSSTIVLAEMDAGNLLSNYATFSNGLQTGDYPHFVRFFWELSSIGSHWSWFQSTTDRSTEYGGMQQVILWENGSGELSRSEGAAIRGRAAWGKPGIAISATGELSASTYSGVLYDDNTLVLTPQSTDYLAAMWCLCSSPEYPRLVRRIDKALKVRGALVKVPFDLSHWQTVADAKYPAGLPRPHSPDPSQWVFNGHPINSDHPLQVAVARLVGYRWPRQTGSSLVDCPALAADGLEPHADAEGVVCLSSVAGKGSAAERLRTLLADAYGEAWSAAKLAELLGDSESLEVWLRDEFFKEHCQVFHQRPFVWHIWDGRKDGFHALVNYHNLSHKTLEKLVYSSLGDWISRQRQDLTSGLEGADGRLAAAEHLQGELKKILDGEKPYDVFVRWKSSREQPLGWNPDLNDGVRMNIRPWIMEARLYRAANPGILRVAPNIKYGKDRGNEPARDPKEFPWFKDSRDRNNDIHLSLNEKRRARGLA